MLATEAPYVFYLDKAGKPLDGGSIYYGVANGNPETAPVPVFWDAAGTQPVAQPVKTVAGYPVRNGTIASVYCATSYSVTVRDKDGGLVIYAATSDAFSATSALAGSGGAAAVGEIAAGTGAQQRTVQDALRDSLYVEGYLPAGYVTDGSVDYSSQVQYALNQAGALGGGTLRTNISLYCAFSITIPANVTFQGPVNSIGGSRGNYAGEYATVPSLLLSNTATINLSRGAVICNMSIINKNLLAALPFASVTAGVTAVTAFAGTAIAGSNVVDIGVHHVRIMGFAQAIQTNLCDRLKFDRIDIDCTAGILTNDVYDISRFNDVHMWPFVTYGYSFSQQNLIWYRSGSAFKHTGHFDGCTITNSFAYGYFTGFDIQSTTGLVLQNCWVEGGGASYVAGQCGYKFSVGGDQTNMISCGVDTCDFGVYVNCSSLKLGIANGTFHANKTSLQVVAAAEVTIDGNHFYYPHAAGGGSPVAWVAPQAHIYLSNPTGPISVTNNYVYGSSLVDGLYMIGLTNTIQILDNKFISCVTGINVDGTTTSQAVITTNSFSGTTTPIGGAPSAGFINAATIHSNIGMATDTYGNLFPNLLGQPADTFSAFGTAGGPRHFNVYGKGTATVPTIVASANSLMSYLAYGYDGVGFRPAGLVRFNVDGAPAAGSMPGTFIVSTTPTSTISPVDRNATGQDGMFFPLTDNAYTCGKSGLRWSAIWSANGTIQTSDARQKTDIEPSALGLDFVLALKPVSYRWIDGGREVIRQVHYLPDGTEIPEGEPIPKDAVPGEIITRTRPGKRRHFGFLAQDVKALTDAAGIDFGGYIQADPDDPSSEQGLRPDQLIAPLVMGLQQLAARVVQLEAGPGSNGAGRQA